MAEKQKTALGPAGEALRHNIKRLRENQKLTFVEMAERLAGVGRPIPVLGLRRIERGERRVDVDDLVALALVLSAAPVDLMVPGVADEGDPYGVTTEIATTIGVARDWIAGVAFLVEPKTPYDFAQAIRSMPPRRAQAASRAWFTPERQRNWNKQALDWDWQREERQKRGTEGGQP